MNLTIIIGVNNEKANLNSYSSNYIRWYANNRINLFSSLSYLSFNNQIEKYIPKIDNKSGLNIFNKFISERYSIEKLQSRFQGQTAMIYYHSGGRYYRKCLKEKLSNEYKPLSLPLRAIDHIICILSSSLYYFIWIALSDTYHVTKGNVNILRLPASLLDDNIFSSMSCDLINDFWNNAEKRDRSRADGTVQKEINFKIGKSKPIIDQIDTVLARHYNFTEEELDFIVNYDIKYRMGKELDAYIEGTLNKENIKTRE